ncbi:21586_t:CDS:2 [Gigaspora rosea]|nr:21586_t:CDS:2 [Gigaspora rosea]
MSTKDPEESIVKIEEDGEVKELYLATNPFGNFVVEFDDYSDLKASKSLSYRKLDEIDTSKQKTFEFTQTQSNLITSENKLTEVI